VVDGAYVLPGAPGYSAEMLGASVAEFSFPDGAYWSRALSSREAAAMVTP
jgi:L-fuconate dehydratase